MPSIYMYRVLNKYIDEHIKKTYGSEKNFRKMFYRDKGYFGLLNEIIIPSAIKLRNDFYEKGLVSTGDEMQLIIDEYQCYLEREKSCVMERLSADV